MGLSNEIISQFVKATNDTTKTKTETTVYGTVVYDGRTYVKIDGSELMTPVQTTSAVNDGDRVVVSIKNHTATITGNMSDPSASSGTVKVYGDKIGEFNTIVAYQITAEDLDVVNATINTLKANIAKIDNLKVDTLEALNAEIESLRATYINADSITAKDMDVIKAEIDLLTARVANITEINVDDLEAINATIDQLKAYNANFTYVSAEMLSAMNAEIKRLDAEQITVEELDAKYANIDFANIGEAAIEYFYATSGLIKDVVIDNGTITGEIVGVTIKGDLIEGNTIKADKLVVKGEDGIYYKLNFEAGTFKDGEAVPDDGLHGSVIVAKTITAEKIRVEDLVAFGATIGGFKIGDNSIYSGVKESIDNTTRGIYMDKTGQMAIGDSANYMKYYKDADGTYKLEISAGSIKLGTSNKTIEEEIEEIKATNDAGVKDMIVEYALSNSSTVPPASSSKGKLETPVIRLEEYTVEASTSAVLGQAILNHMVLGNSGSSQPATLAMLLAEPLEIGEWSTTPPVRGVGQYLWQRITYIYADGSTVIGEPVCVTGDSGEQGAAGQNGTDAITFRIESSLGTVFLEGQHESTVLTARIYRGSTELDYRGEYGYTWYLVEKGGTESVIGTGKTLTIVSTEIAGKGLYFVADDNGVEEE